MADERSVHSMEADSMEPVAADPPAPVQAMSMLLWLWPEYVLMAGSLANSALGAKGFVMPEWNSEAIVAISAMATAPSVGPKSLLSQYKASKPKRCDATPLYRRLLGAL